MKVSLFHTVQVSRLALGVEECPEAETLQSRRAHNQHYRLQDLNKGCLGQGSAGWNVGWTLR